MRFRTALLICITTALAAGVAGFLLSGPINMFLMSDEVCYTLREGQFRRIIKDRADRLSLLEAAQKLPPADAMTRSVLERAKGGC